MHLQLAHLCASVVLYQILKFNGLKHLCECLVLYCNPEAQVQQLCGPASRALTYPLCLKG
jgi:hypothetical protein